MVTTPVRESNLSKAQRADNPDIAWEKLPDDFVLPDDPVDNINQPAIAAALTESLSLSGYLSETAITTTNYGICANYKGKTVVMAPDWSWVPAISVPKSEVERSYTPVLEGDLPLVVMEFLSETEGSEYSIKSSYPPGKLFFYEQILRVQNYIIFDLANGKIDYYRLSESGRYQPQAPGETGRYWLPEANLFLGVWEGVRQDRSGLWLRWWTESGDLLLWGAELSEQERAKAEQERARAEQTQKKAIAKLKELGLTIEQIAETLDLPVEDVQSF
ncbi:MAG: Uma2 family endonuclease [Phormidesmis sp.]